MRGKIINKLRNIITHDYMPGDYLNEQKIAKEFNVSRTPVREALLLLSAEGLITLIPNRGARIADINFRDFRELIEIRMILERGVSPLVIENITKNQFQELVKLNQTIKHIDADDIKGLNAHDWEFHRIIRQASNNRLLEKQLEAIQTKFTMVAKIISYKTILLVSDLESIIQAIKDKNAERLEKLLVNHLKVFIKAMGNKTMGGF